uniref:NIF3-like protein 1 n=1 Tax=Schistosoma japonicum TaxID=6182 RepID=B3GUS9_SCHJA
MELTKIIQLLDMYCLPHLAEKWDNVGLLIEPSPPHRVNKIFITNDLTEQVLDEAISQKSGLIVSYHPPIFSSLKKLTQQHWKQRVVIRCIENKIAVFSPHTGLDAKFGGINDWLLEPLAVREKKSLTRSPAINQATSRLNVVMNQNFGDFVMSTGVGVCTTNIMSDAGLTAVVTCAESDLKRVLDMAEALQIFVVSKDTIQQTREEGCGRLVTLQFPVHLKAVVAAYKKFLNVEHLTVAPGLGKTLDCSVQTVAVCAGSGGSLLCQTPASFAADLFITGELSHHDRLEAISRGISVILAGHSVTERGFFKERFIPDFRQLLSAVYDPGDIPHLELLLSDSDHEPGFTGLVH